MLWLDRRSITPPLFIVWTLGTWNVIDAVALGTTPWPLFTLANVLLFFGVRRAHRQAAAIAQVVIVDDVGGGAEACDIDVC